MNKMIVIINGSGGCGKDTVVSIFSKYKNVENVSSIDVIRECARMLGCNSKTEEDRLFLSNLKQLSSDFYNHPVVYMSSKIDNFILSDNDIIFLHIREPEEIKEIVNIYKDFIPTKTMLVVRDSVKHINSNKSDAEVYDFDYDITIHNDHDLKSLELKIKEIINNISI